LRRSVPEIGERVVISFCSRAIVDNKDEQVYDHDMSSGEEHEMSGGQVDLIDGASFESLLDEVTGHLNAQHGRLFDLTVWLLAHPEAWQGDGLWTPNQYLAWRCGIGPALATNVIAVAERAADLSAAIDAVRRGEMSLDQLMPIVRSVPAWADEQAVSLAKRLTVSQVRRMVKETDWPWQPGRVDEPVADNAWSDHARETGEPQRSDESAGESVDAVPDEAVADENRVSSGFGPDGRWFLHADLDADLGVLFESAIDEARDAEFARRGHGGAEVGAFSTVSDADGLIEIVNRSLDTVTAPARRNRYRVNLYLERDGLLATDRGVEIPAPIARFLTCDGHLDPVVVAQGLPVSVGRSQRTVPDRTRRTVLHRDDRCCQIPGCTTTRGLDLHHIVHWSLFGPTDTWNSITMCSRHHRMHHKHRLGISGNADDPDSLVFTDARGRPIRASGANPASPSSPPRPIVGRYEHPLGERLDRRWVTFVDPSIPLHLRHQHTDIA
jgi:hypothetical protein